MNTSTKNTFARSIRNALLGLATLGIIGAAGTAMAKGPGAHELAQITESERAEHIDRKLDKRVSRMTEKLELSPSQADQVRVILEASMNQRVELAAQSNGDKKTARAEFKALREQTRTQLSGVLTSEQLAELDQMKRERKKRKGDRSGKRMQRMARQLELTPEQVAQIEQIRAASRLEAKQIIELAGAREDAKPELKLLRKQTKADIEAILTPEQAEKFERLRAERKRRRGKRGGEGKRGQRA